MRLPRLRAALLVAVLLPLGAVPLAGAASAPLTCTTAVAAGDWQRLPVPAFPAADGVAAGDTVTAFSVDAGSPQELLVSNGAAVQRSASHGCDWRGVLTLPAVPTGQVPVSGTTARIVALAQLPGGASLAAVQDGSGSASRPRVLSSPNGEAGTWSETSAGLPAQGVPRVLEASPDGSTAYLAVAPVAGSGGGPGGLPGLPGPTTPPAGLLYASQDGGRSWQLRTGPGVADAGFDALSVDPADPRTVYGLTGGRLLVSRDGGAVFTEPAETAGTAVTGVAALDPGQVVAVADGVVLYSGDSGATFRSRVGPGGAGGVAARAGTGSVLVESAGALFLLDARDRGGAFARTDPGVPVTAGSLRGDRGEGASLHALAGNEVLRYVDPPPPGPVVVPPPPGDLPPPPPPPGVISPASRSVRLPVGTSTSVDFRLQQPTSPTPLDLFLLVDASQSMEEFQRDLKANLRGFTSAIVASGVDLHVGLGIFTAGPRAGEPDYPAVDPGDPSYRRPDFFRVLRPVSPLDDGFEQALQQLSTQQPPRCCRNQPAEGGLFGLQELITGGGLEFQGSNGLVPSYQVPPGQTAGFRAVQGVRRLVVHVADDAFTDAYGTPVRDGRPDVAGVGRALAAARVNVVGVGVSRGGGAESTADLRELATANGTFAPPGGVDCGDEVRVEAGEPLVCDSTRNIGAVVARLTTALADRQTVTLVPRSPSPVLGALDASRLVDLDVTVPTDVPFSVGVSCVDVAPGQYRQELDAVLRGTVIASAAVDVTCLAAPVAAEVPPRPDPPLLQDPAPPAAQPVAQAPPAPVPAPPVVQPQAQPQAQAQTQVQTQVNPMTAAALQQQEELALALALQADERAAPSSELAMVDRRRGEQLRAQALLYTAMAGCAALGLARLRASQRPDVRVRRSS